MNLSPRVVSRIEHEFPGHRASQVIELLSTLDLPGQRSVDGDERVCAAILIVVNGDVDRLVDAAAEAQLDWRDVLVSAGLENDDRRQRARERVGSRIALLGVAPQTSGAR